MNNAFKNKTKQKKSWDRGNKKTGKIKECFKNTWSIP